MAPALGLRRTIMNLSHKNHAELKQDAQNARDAIAAKQAERQSLLADIRQLNEKIENLSQTLSREEHVMASTSKLKQPSMTAIEFIAKRKELEAMRGELPTMNEALAFLDRSMESLHGELRLINDWINRKLEQSSKDLVAQLAHRFVESSGEDFKTLVAAVIVANGKQMGFSEDVKSLFVKETSSTLCDALFMVLRDAEGYRLPDFGEARRIVSDRLNTVAEAA
ncbi:hypothetical protein NP590_15575 [Methylomonas sp. SURF-2]|uniref:Uncharacterized protein n=1 Tax=Methylomonas subterranea TaxID=2952225 RepID=A0ABT1TJ83_9GAMM|nr:hypothetical protein [Methylomonas sp. SURF-2]MCQ8105531.1 hypothetical protein [Methylomonas sp. SURF-2]